MKKLLLPLMLSVSVFLTGCSAPTDVHAADDTVILATTYPVYILARTLTADVDGIAVERLNTGEVSCLHDYTLSVNDMKAIEGSDIIAMNGGGMEDFMSSMLAQSDATTIYCDANVKLLESSHDHDHEGETAEENLDPHFWMDPMLYTEMMATLATELCEELPDHAEEITKNLSVMSNLDDLSILGNEMLSDLSSDGFITFHDGFHYFAHYFGLNPLASIEEEEGSEASAKEINEIVTLVNDHNIPTIFTETNGSDATANAVARETGCSVAALNMIMSGETPAEGESAEDILTNYYILPMTENLTVIQEALK